VRKRGSESGFQVAPWVWHLWLKKCDPPVEYKFEPGPKAQATINRIVDPGTRRSRPTGDAVDRRGREQGTLHFG